MSKYPTALHELAHARMREVFGPPDNSLGRDDHWSLKPSPSGVSINVLVNGAAERPAIWVFDPCSKGNSVIRESIANEGHLSEIIKRIQHRLEAAIRRVQSA